VLQICIKRQVDEEKFTWLWTVHGGHNGTALAVLERVKFQLCQLLNGTGAPSWWNDWEPAGEEGEKICIGFTPLGGPGIDVSVKGLSGMDALEGIIDVINTMADQWFHRVPVEIRELVEVPANGHE
jgi:hypothetical protein